MIYKSSIAVKVLFFNLVGGVSFVQKLENESQGGNSLPTSDMNDSGSPVTTAYFIFTKSIKILPTYKESVTFPGVMDDGEIKPTLPNILNDLEDVTKGNPPDEERIMQDEAWKTVVVGSAIALFFIFLAILTKIRKLVKICKTLNPVEKEEDEQNNGCAQSADDDDVAVAYDLWDNQSRVRTVSGVVHIIIDGSSRHQRPRDVKTVEAYRSSFRNFKKSSKIVTEELPSYCDVIQGKNVANPPPDYFDVTEGSSHQ